MTKKLTYNEVTTSVSVLLVPAVLDLFCEGSKHQFDWT